MTTPRRQHGFALLLVLMMIMVASTLGASYLSSASLKLAGSVNMANATRAQYLAEAGVEHAMFLLRTDPGALANSYATPLGRYDIASSEGDYILWAVAAESGVQDHVTITAEGTAEGITRTTSVTVESDNTFSDLVMSYGPRYYWRLSETSNWWTIDEMGRSHGIFYNGVDLNMPGPLVGTDDTAVSFAGNNEFIDVDDINVYGDEMTIIAWVKRAAIGTGHRDGRIIAKAYGAAKHETYWMLATHETAGERYLWVRLRTNDDTDDLKAWEGKLDAGTWYLCAAVYDGAEMRLYVNANEVASRNESGNVNTSDSVNAWIGSNPYSSASRPFGGDIDEVAIFGTALTQEQLLTLFQARYPDINVIEWHD